MVEHTFALRARRQTCCVPASDDPSPADSNADKHPRLHIQVDPETSQFVISPRSLLARGNLRWVGREGPRR